jgi:DNA polymerase-3 subunit gamma/tau
LLFGLYRDIRYSVSPRFELEAVTMKLCLLPRWVSPEELASAVAGAQAVLEGMRKPAGSPGSGAPEMGNVTSLGSDGFRPASPSVSGGELDLSAPGALREQFKRVTSHQNGGGAVDPVDVVKSVFNGTVVESAGL